MSFKLLLALSVTLTYLGRRLTYVSLTHDSGRCNPVAVHLSVASLEAVNARCQDVDVHFKLNLDFCRYHTRQSDGSSSTSTIQLTGKYTSLYGPRVITTSNDRYRHRTMDSGGGQQSCLGLLVQQLDRSPVSARCMYQCVLEGYVLSCVQIHCGLLHRSMLVV